MDSGLNLPKILLAPAVPDSYLLIRWHGFALDLTACRETP